MLVVLLILYLGLGGIYFALSMIREVNSVWHVEWGDMILGANNIWRPSPDLTEYLADGWEPFGVSTVTWMAEGKDAPSYTERIYLRKRFQKESPPA